MPPPSTSTTSPRPRPTRLAALCLLAPPLLLSLLPAPARGAHVPFGYQSDSTHSAAYRGGGAVAPADAPGGRVDPSSYVGAAKYDPLHHALYVLGATYASQVFDGADVYGLTTKEKQELTDGDPNNDGYWWDEMATGLTPHPGDVGIPDHEPTMGDCFYAVLGLPLADGRGGEGEVKVVHSRRFGTGSAAEACSALDVLPASPRDDVAGGYAHDFDRPEDAEMGTGTGDDYDTPPPAPSTDFPTYPSAATPHLSLHPTPAWGGFGTNSPTATPDPNATSMPTPTAWLMPPQPGVPGFAEVEPLPPEDEPPADLPDDEPLVPAPAPGFGGDGIGIGGVPVGSPLTNSGPQARFLFSDARLRGASEPNVGGGQMQTRNAEKGTERRRERKVDRLRRRQQVPVTDGTKKESLAGNPRRTQAPNVPEEKTRSVRLLMAGHVEGSLVSGGYVVQSIPEASEQHPATVYAFAQQVDVRLPAGRVPQDLAEEDVQQAIDGAFDEMEYDLHSEGMDEHILAQELDPEFEKDVPKEDFLKIVTSGVEARALLNDHVPANVETLYPVSIVADPVTKAHCYVALLASGDKGANPESADAFLNLDPTTGAGSNQRAWADRAFAPATDADAFGGARGRPRYGSDYRIVLKKMTIGSVTDVAELSDAEMALSSVNHDDARGEERVTMRHAWMREYGPDGKEDARPAGMVFASSGDPTGKGDALIVAGTTSGRGSAFGTLTAMGGEAESEDLDGFVMKVRTEDGAFSGHNVLDATTHLFSNTHSKRIRSNPGKDDIVAGVCASPPRPFGVQPATKYAYVVGSTAAVLEAVPAGTRDVDFLEKYPEGRRGEDSMEAFLMKIDLATMNTVWTVQVGAILPEANARESAFGYGCAVTRDGLDVYLTGIVRDGGLATDFSQEDFDLVLDRANGGTDVFVASYKAADGSRNFLRQVGSSRDDRPSRGDGSLVADRLGNAVLTGSTRGGLMRRRDASEYRYGMEGTDAAADVFVMSFAREGGAHVPVVADDGAPPASVPAPVPVPVPAYPPPAAVPAPEVGSVSGVNEEEVKKKNGALVAVVAIALGFICIAAAGFLLVVFKVRQVKKWERDAIMDHNLHGGGRTGLPAGDSSALPGRRRSAWAHNGNDFTRDLDDLNIMVEVRNSASGGWHGVYDDEQLQAIDFGVPSATNRGHSSDEGVDGHQDVVEQSLFMEDGLKEIEDEMGHYEIGDMDDVSDEDLIKAYNDAMALDIEPENPDVEFAMQGLGSDPLPEEHHTIT
ncbi:hypothetical protein ACHAWF_018117 [Thalassiosira exigua]